MERVTGIGGFFFRSRDPKALAQWYADHLGIPLVPSNSQELPWEQEAGTTAFSPFPQDSGYFRKESAWMVNFRVRNLDAMAAQLRGAGAEVAIEPKSYPQGRFARTQDPEGNPIELWEPATPPQ
ncbi:MAG: VOC family protein [Acidobacteriota bacterium]